MPGGTGFDGTAPGSGGPRGAGRVGGMFGTGTPGPLRLFRQALSGQISWMLPLALLSSIPLLRRFRPRRSLDRRTQAAMFWLAWLLPMVVFFSIAGFFHQYYLVTLAPGIAALVGAGTVRGWKDWQAHRKGWRWFLPAAGVLNLMFELGVVWPYTGLRWSLVVLAVGLTAVGAALVLWAKRAPSRRLGAALSVLALLVAPGYWALTPMLNGVNGQMPSAGPAGGNTFGGGRMAMRAGAYGFPDGGFRGGAVDGAPGPAQVPGYGGASLQARTGPAAASLRGRTVRMLASPRRGRTGRRLSMGSKASREAVACPARS